MDQRQRKHVENGFALSALIAGVVFVSVGCEGVSCPDGTSEVAARCVRVEDQAAAGADSSMAGTLSSPPSSPNEAGATASGAGSAGTGPAGGVAGEMSSSSGGVAGASGASADPSSGTSGSQAAGSSGSPGSGDDPDPNADTGPCIGRADEVVCEQATLHHCDSSGASSSQETCTSAMLCRVGLTTGVCGVCNPGTFLCTDVQLDRCTDDGQYESAEACPSAALCNESAGMCTDMVCNPNAKSCTSDGTLKTCNDDGSAFIGSGETCGRDMCDARAGRCNRCSPGAKSCRGNSVVTCSADGQDESEEQCTPRSECWTATCSGDSCRESPKSASTRCEGSNYCNGDGDCVECTNDSHCSAMDDDCNDGACVNGTCRATARARGEKCKSGSGLCDRGTCHDVECFSASDCSGGDAKCTDGACVSCGDRKLGPGEECDIGAQGKPGDQLASATYDEYSCDARCRRLYVLTPCTQTTPEFDSAECGGSGRCMGGICFMRGGCPMMEGGVGTNPCSFSNGRSGVCYGNTCFMTCSGSGDCPANLQCG